MCHAKLLLSEFKTTPLCFLSCFVTQTCALRSPCLLFLDRCALSSSPILLACSSTARGEVASSLRILAAAHVHLALDCQNPLLGAPPQCIRNLRFDCTLLHRQRDAPCVGRSKIALSFGKSKPLTAAPNRAAGSSRYLVLLQYCSHRQRLLVYPPL